MTGAEAALAALRDAEREALAPIRADVLAVQQTQAAFRGADDLTLGMVRLVSELVSVEALESAAAAAKDKLRAALAATMTDTGCTELDTGTHRADIREAPRSVIITGEVPPQFLTQPKPAPDKKAIGKMLAKESVPWATLTNPGRQTLYVTVKKQRAA